MLEGAERGEKVEQYVGGKPGRASDIDAGANRSASDLVADVEHTVRDLFDTWDSISEETWDRQVIAVHGGQPAWVCVFSRWRETEIHHVDLDIGYSYEQWPKPFLEATLPDLAATLDKRLPADVECELVATDLDFRVRAGAGKGDVVVSGPGASLLAWLSGRQVSDELTTQGGDRPELAPWL